MNRKERHTVRLADGTFVKFTLATRDQEPFYFVYFRGKDGRRLERSTGQANQKRAGERAIQIIEEEFAARPPESPPWDDAIAALRQAMVANNNRAGTIEDYEDTLNQLRAVFPSSLGPGDITPRLAKTFKSEYLARPYTRAKKREPVVWKGRGRKPKPRLEPKAYTRSPRTLEARLRKLRVIWSRWFIQELEYFAVNPWDDVAPPKLDKLAPRYLSPEEIAAFFAWLSERWQGWRLPVLFFTVKGYLGNRILELCSLTTDQLQDGRVVFPADEAKGRKERRAILPPEVYAEVKALAGPEFVWQAFPAELRERLLVRGISPHKVKPEFAPKRLMGWLQDEIDDYGKAHPDVKRFSAHAFRKRAMTEAWRLGIHPEKAAIAFGCNVRTMLAHYVAMDETATADEVLQAIASAVQPPTAEAEGRRG